MDLQQAPRPRHVAGHSPGSTDWSEPLIGHSVRLWYHATRNELREGIMRKVLILSLAAAALLATTAASSAQTHAGGRSGVHQADFSTCSSSRDACVRGTMHRGHD